MITVRSQMAQVFHIFDDKRALGARMDLRLIAVIVTLIAGCQNSKESASNPAIVEGEVVSVTETELTSSQIRASTVALVFAENVAFCSGVLIGPHHVLTAAHCIPPAWVVPSPSDYQVSFGVDVQKNTDKRFIKRAFIHPEFSDPPNYFGSNELFDVAVVEFEGNLPAGFSPRPFLDKDASVVPIEVLIAGFGFASKADARAEGDSIGRLRKAKVNYFSNVATRKLHLLGSAGIPTGSCNGDSGGPAFVNGRGGLSIVGVTSGGNCNGTSIYTNTLAYRTWIEKVTGLNLQENTLEKASFPSLAYIQDFDSENKPPQKPPSPPTGAVVTPSAPNATSGPDEGEVKTCGILQAQCGPATVVTSPTHESETKEPKIPVELPPSSPVQRPNSHTSLSEVEKYAHGLVGKSLVVKKGNKEVCLAFASLSDCKMREKGGLLVEAKCSLSGTALLPKIQCSLGQQNCQTDNSFFELHLDKGLKGSESERYVTLFSEDSSRRWTIHSRAYCDVLF